MTHPVAKVVKTFKRFAKASKLLTSFATSSLLPEVFRFLERF